MPDIEVRIFADRRPTESGPLEREPLLDLIDAYRQGLTDFTANAPDDSDAANAYAERSYRPPRRDLQEWSGPALTRLGAISALRMAKDADDNDDAEIVTSMLRAALGYFDA